jgi:type IV secretion system protein VirB11
LGPAVAAALNAPDVVEALINADGSVWIDRIGTGLTQVDAMVSAPDRDAAVRLLAHEAGCVVSAAQPFLATLLPESAARLQAVLPPLVSAPVIAVRKRAQTIFRLSDYVQAGIATPNQAALLREAVRARRNIVVAGGAGSGKTTLLNALLAEPAFASERIAILEDVAELQTIGRNSVHLLSRTSAPAVTMRDLVQLTLRLRPDRIVVGEVRDGAALDVLKAWNTGHPGGLLSVHANSARDALSRLEDLCLEAAPVAPLRLLGACVDVVVFIARRADRGRVITEVLDLRSDLDGRR